MYVFCYGKAKDLTCYKEGGTCTRCNNLKSTLNKGSDSFTKIKLVRTNQDLSCYEFLGDMTSGASFDKYTKKEEQTLNYAWNHNNGISRRKAGIYRNGKIAEHYDTIKRVVNYDYSTIEDGDILEYVSRANNSVPISVKVDFIPMINARLQATKDYYKRKAINNRKASKRYKTKRVHCPNCGKWFRVARSSKQKYCSKKCAKKFDEYLNNMHRSNRYIKTLKEKINHNSRKEYMSYRDCRVTDSSGRNIYIGNFKTNESKMRKGKSESWEDYHNKLEKLKPKLKE